MTGYRASSVKTVALIFLMALGAIFLQGTLLRTFLPPIIIPNLMFILLIFLSFYAVSVSGALLVFLLGLMLDLFSGVLLGPWAASFMVVFIIISLLSQRLFVETFIASCLAVFVGSLICSLAYKTITYGLMFDGNSFVFFLVEAFVTAVFAPFVFHGLRAVLLRRESGMAGRPSALF